jgi:hypothetical protein
MKLSPLSFEAFIACTFLVAWIIFAQKFVLSHITRSYGKGK